MIRIATFLLALILAVFGLILNKHYKKISHALGSKKTEKELVSLFQVFIKCLYVLAVISLYFVFLNSKIATLLLISLIMIVSAIFSVLFSKYISG